MLLGLVNPQVYSEMVIYKRSKMTAPSMLSGFNHQVPRNACLCLNQYLFIEKLYMDLSFKQPCRPPCKPQRHTLSPP